MGRKMLKNEQKLKRIELNLDKHTYDYLKSKKINISKMVRQLLKVALFSGSTDYIYNTDYTQSFRPAKLESKDYTGSNPVLCVFNYFEKI